MSSKLTYLLVLEVWNVSVVHLDANHVLLQENLIGLVLLNVLGVGLLAHIAILHPLLVINYYKTY